MSERANRAFAPLLGVAFLVASSLSDPGASRAYSVVGIVSRVERGEWIELASEGPFDPQLRYMFGADTVVTLDSGERISPATLRAGDRVSIVFVGIGGERSFVVRRVVLIRRTARR